MKLKNKVSFICLMHEDKYFAYIIVNTSRYLKFFLWKNDIFNVDSIMM